MTRPFMIRFSFGGKGCYANVYIHGEKITEYHVQVIQPELHTGLPNKLVLIDVKGELLLAEPLNFPRAALKQIIEQIEKQRI